MGFELEYYNEDFSGFYYGLLWKLENVKMKFGGNSFKGEWERLGVNFVIFDFCLVVGGRELSGILVVIL